MPVRIDNLLGFSHYYRVTADGRIQGSDDGRKWRVARKFRGQRVALSDTQTIADAENAIARWYETHGDDFTVAVQVVSTT